MNYRSRLNPSAQSAVRRRDFLAAAAAGLVLAKYRVCLADDRPSVSADVERAVTEGFKFLEIQQNKEKLFDDEGDAAVTVAARVLLAFLAAGHVPDVGKHGLLVRHTVDYLLDQQGPQGWYGLFDRPIRAHVSATTALSQACGVEGNPERRMAIHTSIARAIAVILSRQFPAKSPSQPGGGWGAGQGEGRPENLAVTALSLFSLHACAGIGFPIPQPVTSRALDFTLRCFDASSAGFAPAPMQHADLRSTCAAVVSLFASDATAANSEKLNSAAKFIRARASELTATPDSAGGIVPLAALKFGSDVWSAVGQPLLAKLAKSQEKDGSWPPSKPPGRPEITRTAATASALAVLTMCYPLLPIYQR